tara:strand:- start:3741 stop:3947 length:207 start_codon:yes stop_codon:yes gene_type:complete
MSMMWFDYGPWRELHGEMVGNANGKARLKAWVPSLEAHRFFRVNLSDLHFTRQELLEKRGLASAGASD